MTFSEAAVSRDTGGRFSSKLGGAPEVSLSSFEKREARSVKSGDIVDVESANPNSAFHHAFFNNAEFRRASKAAGYPNQLQVISTGRANEDGHTDNAIVFDIGGKPVELTFHRDREMLVSPQNQE